MISNEELEILSLNLDKETSPEQDRWLASALAASEELRGMQADLIALQKSARLDTPQLPDEMEQRISQAVGNKYPTGEKPHSWFSLSHFRNLFWNPFLNLSWNKWSSLAATMIIAASIGVTVIMSGPAPRTIEGMDSQSPLAVAQRDISIAQDQYRIAIASLEGLATQRISQMPVELARVFNENINIINASISMVEQTLDSSQANLLAYQILSQTYQAKIDLLLTVINS
jgi:hypothetical protein